MIGFGGRQGSRNAAEARARRRSGLLAVLVVLILTGCAGSGGRFTPSAELRALQAVYLADSDLVDVEAWRQRPVTRRLVENAVRLTSPLL